jgi:hypothetical protein
MKQLLAAALLSALFVPTAYAQQSSEPATTALSGQTDPEKFFVFFDMDEATLSPDATGRLTRQLRSTIGQARHGLSSPATRTPRVPRLITWSFRGGAPRPCPMYSSARGYLRRI